MRSRVATLERHEELRIASVERFAARVSADGLVEVSLGLVLENGERRSLEAREDWRSGDAGGGEPVALAGSRSLFHFGFTSFEAGSRARPVGPDGAVAPEEVLIEAADRESAQLLMLTKGRDERWFAWVYPPPPAGRVAGVPLASHHPWMRIPVLAPVTTRSRVSQGALAAVGYPVAFVIDVVTWPVQVAMTILMFSGMGGH